MKKITNKSELYHGIKVYGKIGEYSFDDGAIAIENGSYYICQNERNGASAINKLGYKYSYAINHTFNSKGDFSNYHIKLYPLSDSSKETSFDIDNFFFKVTKENQKEVKKYFSKWDNYGFYLNFIYGRNNGNKIFLNELNLLYNKAELTSWDIVKANVKDTFMTERNKIEYKNTLVPSKSEIKENDYVCITRDTVSYNKDQIVLITKITGEKKYYTKYLISKGSGGWLTDTDVRLATIDEIRNHLLKKAKIEYPVESIVYPVNSINPNKCLESSTKIDKTSIIYNNNGNKEDFWIVASCNLYCHKTRTWALLITDSKPIKQKSKKTDVYTWQLLGEDMLLKEAEKRFPKGTLFNNDWCIGKYEERDMVSTGVFSIYNTTFGRVISTDGNWVYNFNKREWADIISKDTIENIPKNTKFKVGDIVKILKTVTSVTGKINGKKRVGAKKGDIVTILGITTEWGHASESDPRYFGDNFNGRAEDFELVKSTIKERVNVISLPKKSKTKQRKKVKPVLVSKLH